MSNARPENVELHVRRMHFAFEDEGFAPDWHSGSRAISYLFAALSASFPAGEAFFIDSVRAFKPQIQDPALLDEIDDFCKQEGHHTYHHIQFNRINQQNGLAMSDCEAAMTWALNTMRRVLSRHRQLAVTMAQEHFTALVARHMLTEPRMTRDADPKAMALWRWHLIEELEHKATAGEVFRAVGGRYRTRAFEMGMSFLLWPTSMVLMQLYLLAKDGSIWNLRDVARGFWFAFGPRGLFSGLLPGVISYLRPSFHPWQRDDSALIEGWAPDKLATVRAVGGTRVEAGAR